MPPDENTKLLLKRSKNKIPLDQIIKQNNKSASGLIKWLSNYSKLRMK